MRIKIVYPDVESVAESFPHIKDCPPLQPPMKEGDAEENVSDIGLESSTQTTIQFLKIKTNHVQ